MPVKMYPLQILYHGFTQIGLELTEEDVSEWLEVDHNDKGYDHLDDDRIVSYVLAQSDAHASHPPDECEESDEESDVPILPVVSHRNAMEMLDKCLTWLHAQPEATSSVLLLLKELAANKRL